MLYEDVAEESFTYDMNTVEKLEIPATFPSDKDDTNNTQSSNKSRY
jgi:hypothetical protein